MQKLKLAWFEDNLLKTEDIDLDSLIKNKLNKNGADRPDFLSALIQNLVNILMEKDVTLFTSGSAGHAKPAEIHYSKDKISKLTFVDGLWFTTFRPDSFGAFDVLLQAYRRQMRYINMYNTIEQLGILPPVKGRCYITLTPSVLRYANLRGLKKRSEFVKVYLTGEPVRTSDFKLAHNIFSGAEVKQVFGATELGVLLISDNEQFNLKNKTNKQVNIDSTGELVVKKNNSVIKTGDLFKEVEPDIYKYIGRKDRAFKVGGALVNPEWIEGCIEQMPEVVAAQVLAVPAELVGHIVGAKIVLQQTVEKKEFENKFYTQLGKTLARHEIPQILEYVPSIINITSGKREIK